VAATGIRPRRWALRHVVAAASLLVAADVAVAGWTQAGAGAESSRAKTLGTGSVPSVSGVKNRGRTTVTVTWPADTFVEGGPVPAYVVRRYNAVTLIGQGATGGCSGLITATTCQEANVPNGIWRYTVTPAAASWRGTESGRSAPVNG
jgi:hypothetical protein